MIRSLFIHYIEEQSCQFSAWKEELFKMVWESGERVTDSRNVKEIMSLKWLKLIWKQYLQPISTSVNFSVCPYIHPSIYQAYFNLENKCSYFKTPGHREKDLLTVNYSCSVAVKQVCIVSHPSLGWLGSTLFMSQIELCISQCWSTVFDSQKYFDLLWCIFVGFHKTTTFHGLYIYSLFYVYIYPQNSYPFSH